MTTMHKKLAVILDAPDYSDKEKIDRLIELLADEVALRNASDEGMAFEEDAPQLQDILDALHTLGAEVDLEGGAVSKHGIAIKKS